MFVLVLLPHDTEGRLRLGGCTFKRGGNQRHVYLLRLFTPCALLAITRRSYVRDHFTQGLLAIEPGHLRTRIKGVFLELMKLLKQLSEVGVHLVVPFEMSELVELLRLPLPDKVW